MGASAILTGDTLAAKAYSEQLYRDFRIKSYFSRFMGKGPDYICEEKEELLKGPGDTVYWGLRQRNNSAYETAIKEGQVLEGNESVLSFKDWSMTLEKNRYAIRVRDVDFSEKRTAFSVVKEARSAIEDWSSEFMDFWMFKALKATPTRTFYDPGTITSTGTFATAKAALVQTTSNITVQLMQQARAWGLTGGSRTQTPLRGSRVGGKKYLVCLMHPYAFYDLKQDSAYEQARREALPRSGKHDIFTGAETMFDGLIIHCHEDVPTFTDAGAGSNVTGSYAFIMGAQALAFAWGKRPSMVEEEFDYKNDKGWGWNIIGQAGKPVFYGLDYGVVTMAISHTAIG